MKTANELQQLPLWLQSPVKLLLQCSPLLSSVAMHILAVVALAWFSQLQPVQVQPETNSLMVLSVEANPAVKKTTALTQATYTSQPSVPAGQPRKATQPLNSTLTKPTSNVDLIDEKQARAATEHVTTQSTDIPKAEGNGAIPVAIVQSGSDQRVTPTALSSIPTVTPPNFNADYLANPAPAYPALSRRLNEQGTVLLRVHVSDKGDVITLDIERSSRYQRLDQAAREAVARWRFAPARRGQQTVAAQVVVPVVFHLTL